MAGTSSHVTNDHVSRESECV